MKINFTILPDKGSLWGNLNGILDIHDRAVIITVKDHDVIIFDSSFVNVDEFFKNEEDLITDSLSRLYFKAFDYYNFPDVIRMQYSFWPSEYIRDRSDLTEIVKGMIKDAQRQNHLL